MILTTTPTVEGKHITNYHGVVFWEVISWVNLVKDFFANIRDMVWGRSWTYEQELIAARNDALRELAQRAMQMWANAVDGIDIDYNTLGKNNSMLMITASGTAVTVA